jgi:hypothetical protein
MTERQQGNKLIRDPLHQDAHHAIKSQEKADMIKKILGDIKTCMKRPDKPSKAYFVHKDIARIWSDRTRIHTVLWPDCPNEKDLDVVQDDMVLVLSCLLWVGARDCLSNFRSKFFGFRSHCPTDDKLPLEKDQLGFLEAEPAIQDRFYEEQFKFKPETILITHNQITQKVNHPLRRLPFEYRKKELGGVGGYGQVDCVGISPGYIRHENGSSWGNVS